ncbi:flagellar basal body protein FliL [Actinokineospora soli]|uniref:Flagellar basal body protein FliL n=1 Tax=Actinokineospora soli TaxID=1048753 RepID=A0ABW2TX50_9PSEU
MEKTQYVQPVVQQQPAHDENADKTQIVSGQGNPGPERTQAIQGHSERTQAVAPWQSTRPQAHGEPTQVVHGGYPPQPQYGQQPPQAPWGNQGQYDDAPPWSGSEFPPLVATGNPDWIKQGPEVFHADSGKGGRKGLFIALAVVLVLALGGGAFWFFTSGSDDKDPAPTTTAAPAPTTTQRPKDDLEIAELPGSPEAAPEIATFADVEKNKLLTDAETKALKDAKGAKARLAVSSLGEGSQALVLTVETGSAEQAEAAVKKLGELQIEYSMKPYEGTVPDGVTITQIAASGSTPATIRAHYVHKKTVVRVQVYGPDMAEAAKKFDDIMVTQLNELPADA